MNITIAAIAILLISSVFAVLGLGGGILFVPLLHWSGFDLQSVAIPLGLLLNGTNTLLALVPYGRAGLVDWRGGWPMAVAAAVTAPIGALVQPRFSAATVMVLFAAAVSLAAVRALKNARPGDKKAGPGDKNAGSALHGPPVSSDAPYRITLRVGIGGVVGFLGGLLGIGAGFLVAPALMMLGHAPRQTAATTALVVTVCSFAGFAGYAPQFDMPLLLTSLGMGAVVVGSQLGAHLMLRGIEPIWISRGYAALLSVVAMSLVFEVAFGR